MNEHLAALSAYLSAFTLAPAGVWIDIDRDRMAEALCVKRALLARILTAAETKLQIKVVGDRMKYLTNAEAKDAFILRGGKTRQQRALEAIDTLMKGYDLDMSRGARV